MRYSEGIVRYRRGEMFTRSLKSARLRFTNTFLCATARCPRGRCRCCCSSFVCFFFFSPPILPSFLPLLSWFLSFLLSSFATSSLSCYSLCRRLNSRRVTTDRPVLWLAKQERLRTKTAVGYCIAQFVLKTVSVFLKGDLYVSLAETVCWVFHTPVPDGCCLQHTKCTPYPPS